MCQYCFDRRSALWIIHKYLFDKFLDITIHTLRILNVRAFNFLDYIRKTVALKRGDARSHEVKNTTECPHIDFIVVLSLLNNLWCQIVKCANNILHLARG